MSIIRIKHNRENPFVQLNKEALWNEKISLKAIGLWARCISRPNDWRFHINELVSKCKEGRKAIDSAIHELIENNYAVRIDHWDKDERGRFINRQSEYVFFEFCATDQEKQEVLEELKKSFRYCCFGNFQKEHLLIKTEEHINIPPLTPPPKSSVSSKQSAKGGGGKFSTDSVVLDYGGDPPATDISDEEDQELEKRIRERPKSLPAIKNMSSWKKSVLQEIRAYKKLDQERNKIIQAHRLEAQKVDMQKMHGFTIYACQNRVEFTHGSIFKCVDYDVSEAKWRDKVLWGYDGIPKPI